MPKGVEHMANADNCDDPQVVGENISGLSNAAALHGRSVAYIAWGVRSQDHAIIGTTFRPRVEKVKGQELENWLVTQLEPRIDLKILDGTVDGNPVVVFEVQAASYLPVRFRGVEYLRVGSYTKKLADHPEKERALWKLFSHTPFEEGTALPGVSSDKVLELVDYPEFFNLTKQPLPDNRAAIMRRLGAEKLIVHRSANRYDITNLGAMLFARSLRSFERLGRKALRVIIYRGVNRVETVREQVGDRGYAVGFQRIIGFINDRLPQNEQLGQALRRDVRMYPEIAIRELVANALIHQDFTATGAGPMVEIFDDRMDISNPGIPLIDTLRFIDEPPRSRNETLAALMRRMNMCEERGSGIDKVISAIEAYQLPAPDFRVAGSSTVAVLLGPRNFAQMDREERVRACYQHACLLYVSGKRMTNATLRARLGIKESNYPMASRIIRDTIDGKLIRAHLIGSGGKKDSSYVPFWA
jgi:ATP-dependent DNA helicase RecG